MEKGAIMEERFQPSGEQTAKHRLPYSEKGAAAQCRQLGAGGWGEEASAPSQGRQGLKTGPPPAPGSQKLSWEIGGTEVVY